MFKFIFNNKGSMGGASSVTLSTGSPSLAVASTATVYSKSFKLSFGVAFGIWYKAASSGTVGLKIQLEQGYAPPTTEGSADTSWVIADGVADINSSLADTTARIKTVTPAPMTYARLKITGIGSNDASTVLTAYLFQQEYNR